MAKSKTGHALLVAILTVLVGVPSVQASETVELDKVSVTATRVERELMDVPMSVSVVTEEEIKNSSATSIAALLRDVPGVEFTQNGPGLSRISIRGEDSVRTLVLIDGQKLSEHKSMDGAPILIDPARIERIEVIKGPASVLYGSDAIGGVVNIITKKSTDKAVAGNISLGYNGATRGFTQSADIYGHINGWNYSVAASNAKHNDVNGYIGNVPDTAYDQQDYRAALSYDFNEKLSFGIAAEHYDSSLNSTPVDIVGNSYEQTGYVRVPTWERTKYSAFLELKDATDYLSRLRADVWYQNTNKVMENAPTNLMDMTITADNDLDSYGLSLQTDWLIGDNHLLIAGYDFAYDKLDAVGDLSMSMTQSLLMGGFSYVLSTPSYSETSQMTNAAYLAMESTLPSDFTLSYGVRYTIVRSEIAKGGFTETEIYSDCSGMFASYAGTTVTESINSPDHTTDARPVFNVGLVWTGIDDVALRASWAQGFRAPLLQEKYITTYMGGDNVYGNPDLDPETSNNFELGARYSKNGLSLDVATFYSIAKDYIDTASTTVDGADAYVYRNVSSAKTYGLEGAVSYTIDNGFRPYASLTYMRRQFDDNEHKTYNTYTPEFTGRLGLAYAGALSDYVDMNADLYVRAESGCRGYYTDDGVEYSKNYNGHATLNLGFGFNFGEEKEWSVQAEILNILDQKYAYHGADYYEPGINGNLKLTYSF